MNERHELKTAQDAVRMANEIEHLEAVVKELKNRLKLFIDSNGALETGEKVWDYSESVSWQFEGRSLMDMSALIAMEGQDPWEFLPLPAAAIKKLGWNEEILHQYGEKKITKRFTSKKKEQPVRK